MGITSINEVGEEIITTKFTLHPNYNNNSFDYDIGIITLDNPVQLDEVKQKAVRLAAEGTQVTDGQEVIVAGWGATSVSYTPFYIYTVLTVRSLFDTLQSRDHVFCLTY